MFPLDGPLGCFAVSLFVLPVVLQVKEETSLRSGRRIMPSLIDLSDSSVVFCWLGLRDLGTYFLLIFFCQAAF